MIHYLLFIFSENYLSYYPKEQTVFLKKVHLIDNLHIIQFGLCQLYNDFKICIDVV